jgi:hypothetical protein
MPHILKCENEKIGKLFSLIQNDFRNGGRKVLRMIKLLALIKGKPDAV